MNADSINGRPAPGFHATGPDRPVMFRRRTWLLLGIGSFVLALGLVALMRMAIARKIPELTDAAFDAAMERWESNGPESYSLEVEIEGLRPGEVQVEVREGVVTRMARDGQVPAQRRTWDAWSVPGMFETIERELEMAEDPAGEMNVARDTRLWLRCEFDPRYGYPAQFHRAVFGGGPEVYWRVTRFEAH